ncbi:MAG TPA: helix-turn-helix domain-containing protein [Acidimicrobiia bacterium]|jgi:predicted ArsR family transcriptional regulator
MSPIPTDQAGLDRSIADLAAALGDPTRRGIFLAVRQSPEPVTSARIAELFSIHPNVARHHLDRLADEGYLRVTHQRRTGRSGPGAGRPAKCYEATSKAVSIHPGRRYDLLVELLVRVLDRVRPDGLAKVAEEVGRQYGRELAASLGTPADPGYDEAVEALVKVMGGAGFELSAEPGTQRLLTTHCPFGEAATGHPEVVCSLDRGMVAGIMGVLQQDCLPVVFPHTDLEDDCITEVPVQIRARA